MKKFWDFDAVSVSGCVSNDLHTHLQKFDNNYRLLLNIDRTGEFEVVFFGLQWNDEYHEEKWEFIPYPLVLDSEQESELNQAVIDWLCQVDEFFGEPICVGGGSNVPGYML